MRRYHSAGKSLVEVLVVITLTSGALGLCALTLTALFRTEQQLRHDREQQTVATRLADLWRADAHAALSCQAEKECRFTLPGGRQALYTIDGPRIRREVSSGAAIEQRDSFPLPLDAQLEFALATKEGRDFAVLTIRVSEVYRSYGVPVREAMIEAVVNLHGRDLAAEAAP